MINQVIAPDLDPLTLESVFPTPGRNDLCHCHSGIKYKRCCESKDQESWRAVAKMRQEAEAASAMLSVLSQVEEDL
jgi:hypothetical protein